MEKLVFAAVGVYLAVGLLFAVYFVGRGAAGTDPAARNSPITFRLLILPGAVVLWPILSFNLLRHGRQR